MDFIKAESRLVARWVDGSSEVLTNIASVLLYAMIILVTASVVARYVFNTGILFAQEYTIYMFVAVSVFAAPFALRIHIHPYVDIVTGRFPKRVQQWIILFGYIFGLGFLVLFLKDSIALVLMSFEFGSTSLESTATPLAYPQMIIPVGIFFFILQLIIEIGRSASRLFKGKIS